VDVAADPTADVLGRLGVDRSMRVDVGPPPASLSLWVVEPRRSERSEPSAPPRGTILVLHGINDKKDTMLGVARQFAGHGYRAVLVDLRAHGRSSGQWLSFGVVESQDLSQVVDALQANGLIDHPGGVSAPPVGVFGPSFGGGIAIQFAGRDPRVSAVVSVCGFTSMRDVTPGVVRMYAPAPAKWLLLNSTIQRAITEAGKIGGFDPDAASALDAIKRTKAQVLLIHGKKDHKIPPRHSERLHAAAPDHSRLLLLDGHDHDSILAGDAGEVVVGEAVAWFDQWLARDRGPGAAPDATAPVESSWRVGSKTETIIRDEHSGPAPWPALYPANQLHALRAAAVLGYGFPMAAPAPVPARYPGFPPPPPGPPYNPSYPPQQR
jgi:pimeloyl-ACP methyl ester carboxylesterase